jgi:diguanylate cyclase (GGDEF)-like protein/PAS domain S-box-containing protein
MSRSGPAEKTTMTPSTPATGHRPGRGRQRALLGLVGALFVGFAAVLSFQLLPSAAGITLSYVVQTLTVLVAVALLWRRSATHSPRLRRAHRTLAVAMLVGALAGAAAVVVAVVTGEPPRTPSWIDVLHFLWVPIAIGGLLSVPTVDELAGSRLRSLVDGLLAALALWFVTWIAVLKPAGAHSPLGHVELLTVIAYPATDVLAVAMAASVLTRVADRARPGLSLFALGLLLLGLADVAWAGLTARDSYHPDSWVGALSEAGLLLLVAGARARSGALLTHRLAHRVYESLPFLPLAAVLAVVTVIAVRAGELQADGLLLGAALVVTLLVRQAVGARDRSTVTDRLRSREELFRSLVTGTSDLILLYDAEGALLYASPAVADAIGIDQATVLDMNLREAAHAEDLAGLVELTDHLRSAPGATGEARVRVRNAEGEWRWYHCRGHNLLHDPRVRGIVYNSRDVHERHLLEQQISHDASHDALTGLGNLARARTLLATACAPDRVGETTAMLVDLDGFKTVNDTYGHDHGDALLEAVAQRLLHCVRSGDEVCRIGGDEFLLVLAGATDGAEVTERILLSLRRPIVIEGKQFAIGASLGLATTADSSSQEDLLRNADLAMYAAKAAGRGRAAWYEPRMHESATRRMQVHAGLRRSLDEGHFSLHYQPIVRLPAGQVVGLEALLRWTDPEMGPVFPDVFIPVAEESGLMAEIDRWVLDRACADGAAWLSAGVDCPQISVNISRSQVTEDLPAQVAEALARHGMPASVLCIEITESAVVPDPQKAIAVLDGLRALGVSISLDDFGTGQSSLSQLARLPVDTVKIDKSFILSSMRDGGAQRLLTSIIGVCRALELPVVAEGIEDQAVVGYLARNGCEFGQGYHFGRPTPPGDLGTLLLRRTVPASRISTDRPAVALSTVDVTFD